MIKDEIELIAKIIGEYENQVGVAFNMEKPKHLVYFDIPVEELSKFSVEKLANATFELHRYALYIQRIINKNRAFLRWATSRVEEIAGSKIEETDPSLGWNGRMLIAKTQPESCQVLNKFIKELRMKIDRLEDIPTAITKMADSIRDIKFSVLRKDKTHAEEQH